MSEKTSEKTKIKLNTPNKLTIFRILLVPVMVIVSFIQFPGDLWGIKTQWIILDVLFIIGSLTDHWDGHLARKNNQITTFGKFLDPIADKILVISSFLLLVEQGKIPAWIPEKTMVETLVEFKKLLDAGILTQEEFDYTKMDILNS